MDNSELKTLYTNNLRALRESLKKSVQEMATDLNVSTSTLSSYMSGARTVSLEMATHLYKVYGINLIWFVTGKGDMFIGKEPINLKIEVKEALKELLASGEFKDNFK